jgi:hypothetical protein
MAITSGPAERGHYKPATRSQLLDAKLRKLHAIYTGAGNLGRSPVEGSICRTQKRNAMLSNENVTQASVDFQIAQAEARGTARALAQAMVLHERNENPHTEYNAANPSAGVHIRVLRAYGPRVSINQQTKDHNQAVCDLRKPV